MKITPKDILEKEFAKKMNGYDPEQVDEFLDEIIKQFESLLEENENIIAKNEQLKSDLARAQVKADKMNDIEERLMATVVAAQRNATAYVEKAEQQARTIMDIANQNAKTVIESTQLRMAAAQQELKKYENIIADYKKRFRMFLEEQFASVETKFNDAEILDTKAVELSHSISNLTNQLKALDEENDNTSIHLNEILKQNREESGIDLQKGTENLKQIVDDVIDN